MSSMDLLNCTRSKCFLNKWHMLVLPSSFARDFSLYYLKVNGLLWCCYDVIIYVILDMDLHIVHESYLEVILDFNFHGLQGAYNGQICLKRSFKWPNQNYCSNIGPSFALKVRYFHESQIFYDFLLNNIQIPGNEVTSLSH